MIVDKEDGDGSVDRGGEGEVIISDAIVGTAVATMSTPREEDKL